MILKDFAPLLKAVTDWCVIQPDLSGFGVYSWQRTLNVHLEWTCWGELYRVAWSFSDHDARCVPPPVLIDRLSRAAEKSRAEIRERDRRISDPNRLPG